MYPWGLTGIPETPLGTQWNPKDTKSYPLDTPANNTNL